MFPGLAPGVSAWSAAVSSGEALLLCFNHAGRSIPHSAFALTHFVPRAGAPCSPLPAACSLVALLIVREVNHLSLHRRLADLGQCDGDHHEVVAALLHPATVRPATTGRPEARLLRGAALRACHGCEVRSGHATRKSAYGIELSPVWLKCNSFTNDPSQVAVVLIRYVSRSLGGRG